jgi:arylsulfatase A-like enzyme
MITAQDVLPTLLGAAGIPSRAAEFDGADQWMAISNNVVPPTPDYVTQAMDGVAFYRFPWKLIRLESDEIELYRLDLDPTERVDRAATHPSVVEALVERLNDFPRGESIHLPMWKLVLDPDMFGGEEDREPWADRVH